MECEVLRKAEVLRGIDLTGEEHQVVCLSAPPVGKSRCSVA